MKKYDPQTIEPKWQKTWEEKGIYEPDLKKAKKPFFNLMMFPYPSAEGLHVGNMYAFTASDIYGRFKRMQGFDVFEPMGLDGFGIHSENYAIKVGRHPTEQAKISEKNFYRQLHATGNSFAWKEKLETYDPAYYKWTQWIFIQMFKHGLAYRGKAPVNWCPSCKTVLADEQVINGICERCKNQVERKEMEQWFFKITKYADRLLENLEKIDWSAKVKIAQREWIGRSEGAEIWFRIGGSAAKGGFGGDGGNGAQFPQAKPCTRRYGAKRSTKRSPAPDGTGRSDQPSEAIRVFTTRPDTLFGTTFLILSPEHPIVASLLNSKLLPRRQAGKTQNSKLMEIKDYIEKARRKTEQERAAEGKEKTGVFTGLYAINPVNNEEIPIWIADYVLMGYGTGAIMGVPAHDQRDFDFAKNYKLPIREVIKGGDIEKEAYDEEGPLINSGPWNGWQMPQEMDKVVSWIEKSKIGKKKFTYHLRDWLISRQRYWGPPIPIIYCRKCWEFKVEGEDYAVIEGEEYAIIPVPEDDLPVLLPEVEDWQPKGTGKSPLASVASFVKTTCPSCGGSAERETDVSDTFLDSAWYFFRYPSVGIEALEGALRSGANLDRFSNASVPAIRRSSDLGIRSDVTSDSRENLLRGTPPRAQRESRHPSLPWDPEITRRWLPVDMYIGGAEHAVLHLLYTRFVTMAFKDWGLIDFSAKGGLADEPFKKFRAHGLLISEGTKMSKSRGNVVVPDIYISRYGSDTLRCYLMFLSPVDQGGDFRDTAISGIWRFLNRLWRLTVEALSSGVAQTPLSGARGTSHRAFLEKVKHKTIKRVTENIENLRYNTSLSALMEYYNKISDSEEQIESSELMDYIKTLVLLLAPFAPHITEELWQRIMNHESRIRNKTFKIHNSLFSIHDSIHTHPWPTYDPKMIEEEEVVIAVQINGKVRGEVKAGAKEVKDQSRIEKLARENEKVRSYLEGKKTKRIIFVPRKIINFVV